MERANAREPEMVRALTEIKSDLVGNILLQETSEALLCTPTRAVLFLPNILDACCFSAKANSSSSPSIVNCFTSELSHSSPSSSLFPHLLVLEPLPLRRDLFVPQTQQHLAARRSCCAHPLCCTAGFEVLPSLSTSVAAGLNNISSTSSGQSLLPANIFDLLLVFWMRARED